MTWRAGLQKIPLKATALALGTDQSMHTSRLNLSEVTEYEIISITNRFRLFEEFIASKNKKIGI